MSERVLFSTKKNSEYIDLINRCLPLFFSTISPIMNNWQSKFFLIWGIFVNVFSAISHSAINIGGICDCFDDCGICCYGCWCTACLYGENAQQIDGSDYDDACFTYCFAGRNIFAWIPLTDNRRALREKYGLPEEPCDDCTVMSFCTPCAVCQAARELKIRSNMPGEYFLLMSIIRISIPSFVNDFVSRGKVQPHFVLRKYSEKHY